MAWHGMSEVNSTRVRPPWFDAALAGGVGLLLFAVYLATLLPGVGGTEDGPKFQYVGAALGTPHNPGYPLYVLACYAVSKWPVGSLAYRINLLSACWGAMTCALAYLAARTLGVSRAFAACAAAALGLGRSFWAHSVFAEAYTQTSALAAATILALLLWHERRRIAWLYTAVAAASLAFGTHLIIVGAVPVFVWFVLAGFRWRPPRRVLATCSVIVLLGVAQYGYVWVRTIQRAEYLESSATSLRDMTDVLAARQFHDVTFQDPPLVILRRRVPEIAGAAYAELGALGCVTVVAGLCAVWRRQPRVAILLAGAALGPALLLSMLGTVAVTGIILPAVVPCWMLAAAGLGFAWTAVSARVTPEVARTAAMSAVCIGAIALPTSQTVRNVRENDHRLDTYDDDYVRALFDVIPARAAFVDEGEYRWLHVLQYERYVTRATGVTVAVPAEPESVARLLDDGVAVYAFARGFDALDGRLRGEPVTLLGPSLEHRLRRLHNDRIVIVAGRAAAWPAMGPLRLGRRAIASGAGVIVASRRDGPVIVSPGLDGTLAVRQGEPLGDSGVRSPLDIRIDVSRAGAAIALDGQTVAFTAHGLAVAEFGQRLEAAYVLDAGTQWRPPLPMWRPLYRLTAATPPGTCADLGDGAWHRLANAGSGAQLLGRLRSSLPGGASWTVFLASPDRLPVRLHAWSGDAEPSVGVDAVGLERLAQSGIADADVAGPNSSFTRLDVHAGRGSTVFHLNLGGVPGTAWARASGGAGSQMLADVCAPTPSPLMPDPLTARAPVYLGPGNDWLFASGWHGPDAGPAGFQRRTGGSHSVLLVPLAQPAPITLRLAAEPAPGVSGVVVHVNGRLQPLRALRAGWNELAWFIAPQDWHAGLNELVLAPVADAARGSVSLPGAALRVRLIALEWPGARSPAAR
jgi:hypothetical protein